MIAGTPDARCILCRPDMPYHWHHDYMRVDVYPVRNPYRGAAVSIGELDLAPEEAREMIEHLKAAVEIAERMNK